MLKCAASHSLLAQGARRTVVVADGNELVGDGDAGALDDRLQVILLPGVALLLDDLFDALVT